MENNSVVFIKSHIHGPYGPAILLLDIYPREIKAYVHTKTNRNIADVFVIAKN